ncbi:MAG: rubredoxin, partial [Cyanobacteriota bacterium]|nr:rubredoxin [Cyanobacteriota bacterium]
MSDDTQPDLVPDPQSVPDPLVPATSDADPPVVDQSLEDSAVAAASPAEPFGEAAAQDDDDLDSHRFECRSCGYVYDPGEGV